ncbi:MAG: DUF4974 domain-containing protein [Prevotella sp.]|nr:DUF4974 domain-containing protein [Prevotella sp.]
MKKEEKLKRLLEMQESPERFTEEEIRQLMSDDDCRSFYQQMVRAADALHAQEGGVSSVERVKARPYLKIAASVVGVLMLSGITLAAFHFASSSSPNDAIPAVETTQTDSQTVVRQDAAKDTAVVASPKTFENVALKDIVNELAACHHLTVEVKNSASAALRLYYPWNPQMPLQQVVEELNRFEKVQLTVKENTIVIE